ncbi:MAG: redoxin family protein, partial [Planctomycetota bacterium]
MRTSATAAVCVCLAASAAAADRPLREAPARTDVAGSMVGRVIANRAFLDAAGRPLSLASVPAPRATVLAVTSTACPLSKRWYGTLVKTAEAYAGRGVRFLVVNPMTTEDTAAVTADAKRLGDAGTYVLDPDKALADAIGARTTTDVVVLDASRKVVYHGAVDDQYGFGYANAAPKTRYVADALDDLLAGRPVARPATSSPGCLLRRRQPPKTSDAEKPPAYFGHVDRILDANCVGCHREGGVAPFALDSLAAASDYAEMIADVVDRGVMPPWFAELADDTPTGPWANDRTLLPDDLAALKAWIAADAPAGDRGAASVKIARADGWQIGTPDSVFTFDEPVPVKADGVMPYQNVTVETRLAEDRWVRAIEVKPGERAVVHHA